jgi:hypothetical protein
MTALLHTVLLVLVVGAIVLALTVDVGMLLAWLRRRRW